MPNPLDALKKAQTITATPSDKIRAQISDTPITQGMMSMPPAGALEGLLGSLRGWLPGAAKVAQAGSEASTYAPVAETLGEVNPEFTPTGGEGLYNVGKSLARQVRDPLEAAYERIKLMGGR
jgi:hypothetical protein